MTGALIAGSYLPASKSQGKEEIAMKKIIFDEKETETIPFSEVNEDLPIFAKKAGKLRGMIVKEDRGWILRTGESSGATGYHDTLRECLESAFPYDYEFFV